MPVSAEAKDRVATLRAIKDWESIAQSGQCPVCEVPLQPIGDVGLCKQCDRIFHHVFRRAEKAG